MYGGEPNSSPVWTQTYAYDRYGNRESVTATGNTAALTAPADPTVKPPHVEVASNAAPALPEWLRGAAGRAVTDAPDTPSLFTAAAKSSPAAAAQTVGAPTNLSVTSVSSSQVSLSWTASAGAVDHYEVERATSLAGPFAFVGNAATTSFTDTSVSNGTAYLYRVRAVGAGGVNSAFSNLALGAAFTFTDDPLTAGVTSVKAAHLQEVRQAVNAARAAANLSAATWTDASLTGVSVKGVHVQELRDRLGEAIAALGIGVSGYTDATLAAGVTVIKKIHVAELRQRATRGASATSGGGQPGGPAPSDGHTSLSYDTATNRISSAGWEYDAAGNQTRVQVAGGAWQRMEYDAANRLVRVKTDAGAVLASYTYGDSNARLMTQEGNTRTYYVWGGGVIAEYTETDGTATATSPQWAKNYIYLGARLLATQQPNGAGEHVEYHHPDRLGTRVVSNATDANFYEQAALPFGVALNAESTGATNRRFTSYDRSQATGLDYAINRHYDSLQGRFTQVDPIGMGAVSLSDPQSLNLYSYCGNDPVNHVDPDGLFFKKLFGWIAKALKWIAVAVTVAVLVLSVLANPAGLFAFKWAATALKWLNWGLAKIGSVFKFASGGLLAAEGTAATASLGLRVLQVAGAVGAVANHLAAEKKGCGNNNIARVGLALLMLQRGSDKIPIDLEPEYECSELDSCKEIGEKIRDLTKSVGIRHRELDPDTVSYPGHAEVWARQKNILNKCLQKFQDKGCGDGDLPPGFPIKDAVEEAGRKAKRVTGLGDFRRRGGLIIPGILLCTVSPGLCVRVLTTRPAPGRMPVPLPAPAK